MKIKICGLAQVENANTIAKLEPDFVGCIFTPQSKRFINLDQAKQINHPKKIGVFVNQNLTEIAQAITQCNLLGIQLHGNESPAFCTEIKSQFSNILIIKAFSIESITDFDAIKAYENQVDYFLFDTKGKQSGGNGNLFNWDLLNQITINKPYFLAGGIDFDSLNQLKNLKNKPFAIDANSKLEDCVGIKNIEKTKQIIEYVKSI